MSRAAPRTTDGSRASHALLAVFGLSGLSGLIYQVIWVRQFGNIFGNTVYSASLVSGVFMAGLGAGAYVLGRVGDRSEDLRRPIRMYAFAELAVGALGIGLALLFPRLGPLSARMSAYVPGPHGWNVLSSFSVASRYFVAVALIAPATFLMGGTLTLLVRFVVGVNLRQAPARIGRLYGANTVGAAVGALLTDLMLVPALGIFRTQAVAALLNVVAGSLALLLARSAPLPEHAGVVAIAEQPTTPIRPSPALPATACALVLTGFAAMGFEIVWFRVLSSILGESRTVFSILLAVILAGIGFGAVFGAWLHGRYGRPALLLLAAECLFGVTAIGLLGSLDLRALMATGLTDLAAPSASAWRAGLVELAANLRVMLALVGLPSFLMGVAFPLANANVQRFSGAVGRRAGLLYLANSLGNVCGCAVVGFVILPRLGAQGTALLLTAAAVASSVPLYISTRPSIRNAESRHAAPTFATSVGFAVVAMCAFAALPPGSVVAATLPFDASMPRRLLDVTEGVNETIAVSEVPGFFRQLFTNGHSMSSTAPRAQRYMRAFAHIPLLMMGDANSALVICFGVGTTTHAASLHDELKRLDVADLSENVLEHSHWFARSNHEVLTDPRVSVFVNDGRHHLLMQPEAKYDLITLEPPPLSYAGVASLYSREFYELARSRLTTRGYITQWLPAYQVPEDQVRAIVRSFVDVFPESVLLSGDGNELVLMGTRAPSMQLDLEAVRARLARAPAVQKDLDGVLLGKLTEIAGMFAASAKTMVASTADSVPVTDDRPSLEYSDRFGATELRIPKDLFDVSGIATWCPDCLARLPYLPAYLRVRGAIYASEAFLLQRASGVAPLDLSTVPGAAEAVSASPYLQALVERPGAAARRVALESFAAGHLRDAEDGLETARTLDPADPETYEALARVFQAMGKPEVAARASAEARRRREVSP